MLRQEWTGHPQGRDRLEHLIKVRCLDAREANTSFATSWSRRRWTEERSRSTTRSLEASVSPALWHGSLHTAAWKHSGNERCGAGVSRLPVVDLDRPSRCPPRHRHLTLVQCFSLSLPSPGWAALCAAGSIDDDAPRAVRPLQQGTVTDWWVKRVWIGTSLSQVSWNRLFADTKNYINILSKNSWEFFFLLALGLILGAVQTQI